MIGLLGKKIGMIQIFEEGEAEGVTVIEAGPCWIVQVKKDAIQVGFEPISEKRVNKPMLGHFKKANVEPLRYLREFKVNDIEQYKVGQQIDVGIFKEGDLVDIVGISKGKGFAGIIKRYGAHGGPASHGSGFHRGVGSVGMASGGIPKGKKMPGRKGSKRVTVQNLKVLKIIKEKNTMLVKGSTPGKKNSLLIIKPAIKVKKSAIKT